MRPTNLIDEQRQRLGLLILSHVVGGKSEKGIFAQASAAFGVTTRTVRRIWAETKKQLQAGENLNLTTKKKGKKGRPQLELNQEAISLIPFRLRGTQRSLANQAHVSKTTVSRWVERGLLRSHTSAIKPALNPKNVLHRLQYVLSKVDPHLTVENSIQFKELDHVVHIDEKWFNITQASNRYYLTSVEREPYRSCQSKRYINKVMFMCVVARPQFELEGEVLFDGKIGIFPFTFEESAVRNSKNRPARTIVTKPIERINKLVIRQCIIDQVLPSIKARWSLGSSGNITIQQDNAKPHISPTDPEFVAAAKSDGFNITLTYQPPNSPDLNVLDLGFFRPIQALQTEKVSKTVEELVSAVEEAYERLGAEALDRVFISLQACMIEVMKCKGHNDYKLPHMGKGRLARVGLLRRLIAVEPRLMVECLAHLTQVEELSELQQLLRVYRDV